MRCKICGAPLKKEGDICSDCYKKYQEDESLKNDKHEMLKLKRKYSIAYEIYRYTEMILIFLLAAITFFTSLNIWQGIVAILLLLILLGILLFVDKRIAIGTRAVFYEKKVVYKFDLLFIHKEKIVKYSDLKDIRYFQTRRQKKVNLGDICVYAKGSIPGATLLNGFQIKCVENPDEVIDKLRTFITIEE